MRKLLSLLLSVVAMALVVAFPSKAMPAPSLDQASLTLIEGGAQDLYNLGFTSQGLLPEKNSDFKDYFMTGWQAGYLAITSFDDDDISLTELTSDEKSELLQIGTIYNALGEPVTVTDPLYLGRVDNGYFSGVFYVDENGHIVSDSSDLFHKLLNLKYGGHIKDTVAWSQMFSDISADIFDNSYVLPLDENFNITSHSYYSWFGVSLGQNRSEGYIFIPNIYAVGVTVGGTSGSYINGRALNNIYYNDPSDVTAVVIQKSNSPYMPSSNPFQIYEGSWTIGGTVYHYNLQMPFVVLSSNPSDHDAFMRTGAASSQQSWNFSQSDFIYNAELLNNMDYVAFKQLQFEDDANKVLNYDDTFDYNQIQELLENLNNLQPSVNNEFNYSSPITENNFYNYTYVTDDNRLNDSDLPFPSVDPNPVNSPFLDYDPIDQPSFETSIDSFQNLQVPFISGLHTRYPFSIPWDIQKFLLRFNSEPMPPAWDFDWKITIGSTTYVKHFQGDLSDFNGLAEIFRNLILIGFIIALCKFSYDHHF